MLNTHWFYIDLSFKFCFEDLTGLNIPFIIQNNFHQNII